ncbi:MAG: 16S rRNA (cytosine(1402)-N(4))-methyltransferase RsmH [Clostridia bacterium]|nr:16S rRNA (cytosine(1402)-N(4))-methyltransferase RsmH [Clostridia bacterium]
MQFNHISVLKEESILGLNIKPDGVYVDCTLGGGGHSLEIARRLTTGKLICFDKDEDAIKYAKTVLSEHLDKITIVHDNFKNIKQNLLDLGITKVDGILCDLGVSSYQLDTAERGFSYRYDARLDMRMDKSKGISAYEVVNNYTDKELQKILFNYGEEKNTFAIVKKIINQRKIKPIETTFELKDIITSCYPPKDRNKPALAGKAFQAIRIEVNGELDDLDSLEDMIELLEVGGRLCVITFHPLEDRIAKNVFKMHSTDCLCPPHFPKCVCGHASDIKLVSKKPIMPTEQELLYNSRSASAKLRVVEKK